MSPHQEIAAALVALAMLAGCGAMPKVDSDRTRLSTIHTVAVIRAPEPKTYTILNMSHPGMMFGLIGGIAAEMDAQSKQETLSKAYREQGVHVTTSLAESIANRLKAAGYDARAEDGPWVEKEGKQTLEFEAIRSDADAVLVAAPALVGFVAPHMGSDYYPTITAVATVLGKDRKQKLYVGYHASGWQMTREGWRNSPAAVTYPNFSDIMADTKASAASLDAAAAAIAASIVQDLPPAVR